MVTLRTLLYFGCVLPEGVQLALLGVGNHHDVGMRDVVVPGLLVALCQQGVIRIVGHQMRMLACGAALLIGVLYDADNWI